MITAHAHRKAKIDRRGLSTAFLFCPHNNDYGSLPKSLCNKATPILLEWPLMLFMYLQYWQVLLVELILVYEDLFNF